MVKSARKFALPGDMVAVPEEFLPGKNVYENDMSIRALQIGIVLTDIPKREIHVRPATGVKMPLQGDYVTGQVEFVQTNSATMRIYYVNGRVTEKGFSGVIPLRSERSMETRRRTLVKLGDIVTAKVVSTLNAIIQLSIDEDRTGVIFSLCSNCGNPLTGSERRAKCIECGNAEERKFSSEFGRVPLHP